MTPLRAGPAQLKARHATSAYGRARGKSASSDRGEGNEIETGQAVRIAVETTSQQSATSETAVTPVKGKTATRIACV